MRLANRLLSKATLAACGAMLLATVAVFHSYSAIDPEEDASNKANPRRGADVSISEVTDFVKKYYRACSDSDLFVMMGKFAQTVDYLSAGKKDHTFIRDELRAYIKRWPVRSFTPAGTKVVQKDDGDVVVTFDVVYTLADEKTQKDGRSANTWVLRRVDGDLQILSQRETVFPNPPVAVSGKTSQTKTATTDEEEPAPQDVEKPGPKVKSGWKDNAASSEKPGVQIELPTAKQKETPAARVAASPVQNPPVPSLKALPVDAGPPRKHGAGEFILALDIGHSPLKGGAVSASGVFEYEFNRRMAQELFKQIQSSGLTHSFIINPEREEISLPKRGAVANAKDADLFLSIHHDSVKDRFLKDWEVDGKDQKYCDDFHGYSLFYSRKNAKPAESLEFATILGQALLAAGFTPTLHHVQQENRPIVDKEKGIYAFDDLIVLKTAKMPAVLLECGVIVNRGEEKKLNDAAYRKRLVDAVSNAIQTFVAEGAPNSKKN